MYSENTLEKSVKHGSEQVKFDFDTIGHYFKKVSDSSWDGLRKKLEAEAAAYTFARLTIYCLASEQLDNYRKELEAIFLSTAPAIEVLAQPPLGEARFVAIVWMYKDPSVTESATHYPQRNWKVVSTTISAGAERCYQNMQEALHNVAQQLQKYGLKYQDVIRTWIYVGGITRFSDGVEHYEAINLARKNYYDRIYGEDVLTQYPASTGIGLSNRDIVIAALACKKHSFEDVSPVENIAQVAAWNYPVHLAKVSPTFSRAYRVRTASGSLSFISGTASIIGADTVHIGDAQAQTEVTIDNLERVIASSIQQPATLSPLSTIIQYVCYIKNPEDLEKIRQICHRRLPLTANQLFVKADVCRDNLLVEIEAVAYEAR